MPADLANYAVAEFRSRLLGCLHIHRTDNVLNALAATLRALFFVLVMLADRLGPFKVATTFLAFEFIIWHRQPS